MENKIEDIFVFKYKMSLLLFLLLAWIWLFVWWLNLKSKLEDYNKKILAYKFFLYKSEDDYETAKKILSKRDYIKTDYFGADELPKVFDYLKQLSANYLFLQWFNIKNISFTKNKIQYIKIQINGYSNTFQNITKLLEKLAKYNILSKYSITYKDWRYFINIKIQIYYKKKLSKDIIKKYKIKEEKIQNKHLKDNKK